MRIRNIGIIVIGLLLMLGLSGCESFANMMLKKATMADVVQVLGKVTMPRNGANPKDMLNSLEDVAVSRDFQSNFVGNNVDTVLKNIEVPEEQAQVALNTLELANQIVTDGVDGWTAALDTNDNVLNLVPAKAIGPSGPFYVAPTRLFFVWRDNRWVIWDLQISAAE